MDAWPLLSFPFSNLFFKILCWRFNFKLVVPNIECIEYLGMVLIKITHAICAVVQGLRCVWLPLA